MRRICLFIAMVAVMGCGSSNSDPVNTGPIGYDGAAGTPDTDRTIPATGLACPLGTWIADMGETSCLGGSRTIAKIVIEQSVPGQYIVTSVYGPYLKNDPVTGQTCDSLTITTALNTYEDGVFPVFTSTFSLDTATCPGKRASSTFKINSICTQADVTTVSNGCKTCNTDGSCSGCGSMTCTGAGVNGTAVRSLQ